jgi:hypothetical protein
MQITMSLANGERVQTARVTMDEAYADALTESPGMPREHFNEMFEQVIEMFSEPKGMSRCSFKDEVLGDIQINPENIVWVKVDRDE